MRYLPHKVSLVEKGLRIRNVSTKSIIFMCSCGKTFMYH